MVLSQNDITKSLDKKRVVFCTYASIYSSKVMEQLIADNDIELVGVINSTRVLNSQYGHIRGALKQIRTSGLRYSSYLFIITDIFKFLQPVFLFKKWPLRDVHGLANFHNIPIHDTKDINNIDSVDFIKSVNPDYLLGSHFNQLIKQPVLALESLQCINIHPSLLPSYKGVDPVFFAMQDEQDAIGVTVHRMAETFDTGEILMQRAFDVDKSKSLIFNNCLLFQEGIRIALRWIKDNQKQLLPTAKENLGGNYDSWPTSKDVRKFKKTGKRLIALSELWKR